MRFGLRFAVAVLAVAGFAGLSVRGEADDNPKYTTKEIMKTAHDKDEGILGKVMAGKASDAEKKELVELYVALGKNKPEKGGDKSWKAKTDALVTAATEVKDNKDGATKTLGVAADCRACHTVHKMMKK
jgi:hypothetical protein